MNIFILFGQTASGKTAKALELCEKYNGEIVNFDSRQIYKKLDIVTGKDIPKDSQFVERVTQNVPNKYNVGYYEYDDVTRHTLHVTRIWLYDIIDPKQPFSSADYVIQAEKVISDILSRGKTPILVGGTGYYLKHLMFGTPDIAIQEDWELRKRLENNSVEELQTMLKGLNEPMLNAMNNSDIHNPRRLIRRIEIATSGIATLPAPQTKETLSARIRDLKGRAPGPMSVIYLPFFHNAKSDVQDKIAERVEARISAGALSEVKKLLSEGYTKDDPGLNAIGYKQLIGYLEKKLTLSEAKKQWATAEVQYAKRQKTYFAKYFKINEEMNK